MQTIPLTPTQFLVVITLPLVLYFGVGAARKAIEIQDLRGRGDTIRREIDGLQARNADLKKSLEFLKSDSYLEKAAREQLGLIKPGERGVAVIGDARPTAKPASAALKTDTRSNPEKWWDYLFAKR